MCVPHDIPIVRFPAERNVGLKRRINLQNQVECITNVFITPLNNRSSILHVHRSLDYPIRWISPLSLLRSPGGGVAIIREVGVRSPKLSGSVPRIAPEHPKTSRLLLGIVFIFVCVHDPGRAPNYVTMMNIKLRSICIFYLLTSSIYSPLGGARGRFTNTA